MTLYITSTLTAKPIKCFVPSKPWAVTIDLNDFEPSDILAPKTILGGNTKDGVNITIIIETTKPGTNPAELRKLYGYRYALGAGQKETIEEIDLNDISVITYRWAAPALADANETTQKRAKEYTENVWGFNGYVVKDDIAFDVHLSTDMTKHSKAQMLDIIKSLQNRPSTESEESRKLFKIIEANPESSQNEKPLTDFISKYPTNPEAYCFLAEHYLQIGRLEDTKTNYLKALENHKVQPLTNSLSLWKCYYGLGRYFGGSGEYAQSERYSELSYNLAKKGKLPAPFAASSAYSLACMHADLNQSEKSVKYLIEAIRLNPRYKDEVKQNPSFNNIKEDPRLKSLIGR
jgi:tetratricopeptide (TPR) repeat protein